MDYLQKIKIYKKVMKHICVTIFCNTILIYPISLTTYKPCSFAQCWGQQVETHSLTRSFRDTRTISMQTEGVAVPFGL